MNEIIPVIIISFNRLTWLMKTIDEVFRLGGTPIIVDNGSTYPPLVEYLNYLRNTVFKPSGLKYGGVCVHQKNLGAFAPWEKIYHGDGPGLSIVDCLFQEVKNESEYYCVTDPDLRLGGLPEDTFDRMKAGFFIDKNVRKCGVGLSMDIPDKYYFKSEVMRNERPNWGTVAAKVWKNSESSHIGGCTPITYYRAGIDTTFAMYRFDRPVQPWIGYKCLRIGSPYCVQHLPWLQGIDDLTEEDLFYHRSILKVEEGGFAVWTEKMRTYLDTIKRLYPAKE